MQGMLSKISKMVKQLRDIIDVTKAERFVVQTLKEAPNFDFYPEFG